MTKKAILLFGFIITILLLLFIDYLRVKNNYDTSLKIINDNLGNSKYSWFFDEEFVNNGNQYLNSHNSKDYINDLKPMFDPKLKDKEIEDALKSNLIYFFYDPFTKEKELGYFPIYNNNDEIKGYVLLSAGIDGNLNNISNSKLYKENYKKSNFILYEDNYEFNYFEYYF
jgi:hypothetical protein